MSIQEARTESEDANLYRLKRELRVQPTTRHVPIAKAAALREGPASPTLDEARARQIALWHASLDPLEGQHDRDAKRLLLPVAWSRLFPTGFEVIEDRVSRVLGRSLVTEYLKGDARGVLISQYPAAVSYIDVAPLALTDLRDALDRPAFDEKVYLEHPSQLRIFYAGCRVNPDGEPDGVEREHIFEWGFGYWVAVPESKLRFQDDPIQAGELRFFNGDRISALKFIRKPPTAENPVGDLVLSIENVSLSTAHRLYLQARDYRIVHTVHVRVPRRGQAEIAYVEGFEARRSNEARRRFDVPRARLNEAGSQVLTQRARQELGDSNDWEGVVLGRFDRQAYERSFGRDVIFVHTRLSLTPQAGYGHLTANERFFALTNRIRRYGENDIAITLQHIPGLHPADIDPEFGNREEARRTFLVTRRHFSYAENMLNRLQRELQGDQDHRYVMVRLRLVRERAIYYIRDGTPPRRPEVLDSLHKDSAGGVFAIFAGSPEDGGDEYRFELRPGVIIDLASDTLDMPTGMLQGDVVRIMPDTKPDARAGSAGRRQYRIKRATYSDIRYAEARRPVVALPMQNLKRDTPSAGDIRRAANSFTIGDFPGPRAHLRMLNSHQGDNTDRRQYRFPSRDNMLAFMSMSHPKLAWLQQTEQTEEQWAVVITPDFTRRIHAGRLKIGREEPHALPGEMPSEAVELGERANYPHQVSVHALPHASPRLSETRTDWLYLTFRDETAAAMEELVETQAWKYHDKVTVDWAVDERTGEVVSETPNVSPMSALEGPLFFEITDGIAILRYSEGELPLHAIGYKNLLSLLAGDNGEPVPELRCAVAGVSRDPTGEYAGVYLEVQPGRIVEVPPEMARWHCDGGTVDLTLFSWNLFAPGDRVQVSKPQQIDRYAPERVHLEWNHGVRNAFGPIGAILPKYRDAADTGAKLYGRENFVISIPTTDPDRLPERALIGGAGNVQPVPTQERELRGATVLLVRGADARVAILGFEDWRAAADRHWNWSEDALMKPVVSLSDDGTPSMSHSKLLERVDLAGGALPVTIELAFRPLPGPAEEGRRPTLFFSRRHQDPRMREGQIAVARVLGRIPVSGWIMLGIGGRSFAIPGDQLVLGAPDNLSQHIVDYLTRHAIPVWVRRTRSGYEVGVAAPRNDRTSSTPVGIPDLGDGKFHGLICVDVEERTLRWLPATRAAAAPLTAAQAATVFSDRRLQLSASVMADQSISLLDDRKARQELHQLRIGHSLRVKELDGTGNGRDFLPPSRVRPDGEFCLVQSRTGDVIMAAALPKRPANMPPRTLIAEVAERQVDEGETKILVVASGARRVIPDFPSWIALNSAGPTYDDGQRVLNGDDVLGGVAPRVVVQSFIEYLKCGSFSLPEHDLARFKRGYRSAQTVSLVAGIAVICLDAVGSSGAAKGAPKNDFDFIRDLGHRALRSFHLEILGRRSMERQAGIIPTSESNSVTHGIDELLSELVIGISPDQCGVALRHLVDCLALDGGTAHDRAVVNALAAAIGEPIDLHALIDSAEILANVARVVRPILICSPEKIQHMPECVGELVGIGRTLIESNIDIPLLEPLVRWMQ